MARKAPVVPGWRGWLARMQTPGTQIPPERFEAGISAKRSVALAAAITTFVLGFSVDDLHVLRWPAYLVGSLAALTIVAIGPLVLGRRFAMAHRADDDGGFHLRALRARRAGAIALLLSLLGLVAWLVVFSSGVPPWAT